MSLALPRKKRLSGFGTVNFVRPSYIVTDQNPGGITWMYGFDALKVIVYAVLPFSGFPSEPIAPKFTGGTSQPFVGLPTMGPTTFIIEPTCWAATFISSRIRGFTFSRFHGFPSSMPRYLNNGRTDLIWLSGGGFSFKAAEKSDQNCSGSTNCSWLLAILGTSLGTS